MPYFIGMNSEVRYFLKLRCCICVRNRPLKPDPQKSLSLHRRESPPHRRSECGPDKKSYLISGTVILPMLNNGARYQLEGIFCRIFLENGLSGDRLNC
jgi:hypothetical protein